MSLEERTDTIMNILDPPDTARLSEKSIDVTAVPQTPDYVRGGGGNTSCKDAATLWVKPSGTTLAGMTPDTFVAVEVPITLTVMLQASLALSVPPVRLMVPPPSGALRVLFSQSVKALDGVAIVTPAGRLSVNAKSVTRVVDSELSMSKRSVVVLPGPMVAGMNDLEKPTSD